MNPWLLALGNIPEIFDELFHIDARSWTDSPNNIVSRYLIDVVIPFGKVGIWKLTRKRLLDTVLGIFKSRYHLRFNKTGGYQRASLHGIFCYSRRMGLSRSTGFLSRDDQRILFNESTRSCQAIGPAIEFAVIENLMIFAQSGSQRTLNRSDNSAHG